MSGSALWHAASRVYAFWALDTSPDRQNLCMTVSLGFRGSGV